MSYTFDNNIVQHNKLALLHNSKDIFFCKTDYLQSLFEDLASYTTPVTLITGNSDYAITDDMVNMAPSCVKLWFGQAMNSDNLIATALPYGLENSEHNILGERHGYGHPGGIKKVEIAITPPKKTPTKLVYANFSIHTYKGRDRVAQLCRDAPHITYDCGNFRTNDSYEEFVDNVLDHQMVVCPRGNAPAETHRFWEVLYMNRIPIIKLNKGNSSFVELPVIVLNDWNQLKDTVFLTEELKRVKNNPTRMLDMSYWADLILKKHEN